MGLDQPWGHHLPVTSPEPQKRPRHKLPATGVAGQVHGPGPSPPLSFSFCEAGRAPPALGRLVSHKMGGPQPPSQATQEALLPEAGSAAPPAPVDALGTVSPLFAPLIPICSATAQIQFWRRVPPASNPALSLRNHSNPPKQRPSNLNKPSDISLAGQDAERDSPHARRFATLGLC